MNIQLLALDGVFDTGLSVLMDAFSTANELAAMQGLSSLRFQVNVVGMQKAVRTAQGLTVPAQLASMSDCPDWLVVPAIGYKMPDLLQPALARKEVQKATHLLRECSAQGVHIGAACIGTFVLAESGLLNGQTATTTWWLAAWFRQRYPQVQLDESRMLVHSNQFLTSGAALSHIDLALWLIRQESPALAALTANYLVVDSRPSQSAFAISDHLHHSDPLVTAFEQWSRQRLAQGFSLQQAADALATSKRTLARRLRDTLGKTPLS